MSIQALILCEKPWYNEPGRELDSDERSAIRYNLYVQYWTIRFAILPWARGLATKGSEPAASKITAQKYELGPSANLTDIMTSSVKYKENAREMPPYWRDIVELYLKKYAAGLLERASEAMKQVPSDYSGLASAITAARELFRARGYVG